MGSDAPDPLGYHRRAGVIEVPGVVADEEPLHRRIHPTFVRPDGSVSSQAFRDREMSVDRGLYWEPARSLQGYDGYGLTSLSLCSRLPARSRGRWQSLQSRSCSCEGREVQVYFP